MNANLEPPIKQALELENLVQDEKLALLTIALYGDGSDNRGLPALLTANPQSVRETFLATKNAAPDSYKLLCGRLAIHIVAEYEAKNKEDESNYQRYKIPWEGILEPFFKNVLDN